MIVPSPAQVIRVMVIITVRLFIAMFKITGYLCVAAWQASWFTAHGQRHMVGETIGRFGEAIVDALAEIVKFK